jgi:ABC-2 type transport system permease protein
MFPDAAARNHFALSFDNPIMVAMMGPIYGIDNYTPGAMYGGMMLLWFALTVAAMNIFFVVRHTRADEESGRSEVVRSLPTGRLANINATMIAALILNAVLALLIGLGLTVMGIESMDFAGSMVYGAASGVIGFLFAAITALFCQLSSSSSGASSMSFLTLGVFYMIRAAGDAQGSEFLACLSPLGLVQRSQVYVQNNLWPMVILLLEAVVIALIAYRLNSMRDIGQGFIAARPGRSSASPALRSSWGLSWRLLRIMLISWLLVLFSLGASYGSVVADISSFISESPEYMTVIGVPVEMLDVLSDADKEKLIVDSFATFITSMMTLTAMVPLIAAVMKVRSEEKEGRTEQVLARAVGRTKYLSGFVILAIIASVLIQFATAIGLYSVTDALTTSANPFVFSELLAAFFAYLPALWIMIGIAVLFVGLFPKATSVVWSYFGVVCFTSFIGSLVLPEWMLNISPMNFVPQQQPFEKFTLDFVPLTILTALAIVVMAVGFVAYHRRDTVAA